MFSEWQTALEPVVEVCALQLPGRGSRFNEAPHRSMPELVEAIANAIAIQDALPFVFFGHSLGALVAFEVACYCDRHGRPMPELLFVSGCEAPQLRSCCKKLHLLSDNELISELNDLNATPPEVLRDRRLMELLLPMLRADFCLAERYSYHPHPRLKIPISVLAGKRDENARSELVQGWQKETADACDVRWFDGDHFFLNQERSGVLDYLCTKMRKIGSQAQGISGRNPVLVDSRSAWPIKEQDFEELD